MVLFLPCSADARKFCGMKEMMVQLHRNKGVIFLLYNLKIFFLRKRKEVLQNYGQQVGRQGKNGVEPERIITERDQG